MLGIDVDDVGQSGKRCTLFAGIKFRKAAPPFGRLFGNFGQNAVLGGGKNWAALRGAKGLSSA